MIDLWHILGENYYNEEISIISINSHWAGMNKYWVGKTKAQDRQRSQRSS